MNRTWSNCFLYAFDRLNEYGGYICIGMSTRANEKDKWNWQHLGAYDNAKHEFTSFTPPTDLNEHWLSLFKFHGKVLIGDQGYRRPMTKLEMAKGIFVALPIAFIGWLAHGWYKKHWGAK